MALVVQLVPVGSAPRSIVRDLADPLRQIFGCQINVAPALGDPKYAYNKDRRQYHAAAILRRLSSQGPHAGTLVLGVADVDLFVPERPFVFGEADRQTRAALLSLARLRESHAGSVDTNVLRRRGQAEAIHEIGHLLGLSHCDDFRCAMFFSATVADTDHKNLGMCNECRNELARSGITPAPAE